MEPPVGRDTEREQIARFVAAATAGRGVLVLEGPAGIGKTTLFHHALDLADRAGMRILRATPAEGETGLAFAGLTDLLADVDDADLDALHPPRRDALRAATLRDLPADGALDDRAVGAGMVSLLDALSASHPVLVAVDDEQWLDDATRAALVHAFRRTRGVVGLLVGRRTPAPHGLAEALGSEGWQATLTVGPMSKGATFAVVQRRLGTALSRLALHRVWEASEGNPLFAIELVRAGAAQPDRAADDLALSMPLQRLLEARLAVLPHDVRDALVMVAAASRPTPDLVRLLRLDAAVTAAEQAGVVVVADGRFRFAHPLLGAALLAMCSPSAVRDAHARLAAVVTDVQQRARHLALAEPWPSERAAAALEEAVEDALRRGTVRGAVELAGLAVERTEGSDPVARWRRTTSLGRVLYAAGETNRAWDVLVEVSADCPDPLVAADADLLLTEIAFQRGVDAAGWAGSALRRAGDDVPRRARALLSLVEVSDDPLAAAQFAEQAAQLLERSGCDDPLLRGWAAIERISTRCGLGHGADRGEIDAALRIERAGRTWRSTDQVASVRPVLLKWIDEHEAARDALIELRERAEEEGNESLLPYVLGHLVGVLARLGDLPGAAQVAAEHLALAETMGLGSQRMQALYNVAFVHAWRGSFGDAERAAAEVLEAAEVAGERWMTAGSAGLLGLVLLETDRVDEAVQHLDRWRTVADQAGIVEPGISRYHHERAVALLRSGRTADAVAQVDELEELAARAQRHSAAALAARCRAHVHAAAGELDAALTSARRALELDAVAPVPFERARTMLVLGAVHRRRKEKAAAREAFDAAAGSFTALGAPGWAERAQAEHARVGERAAHVTQLTATERRVAELAASGLTNRQVAEQAFMSPKTVEANLAKVYRKLGISSRAELGARMAGRT